LPLQAAEAGTISSHLPEPALPSDVFAQVTAAWAIQDYAHGERLLAAALQRHPDHWHLRTCHAAAIAYCSRFRSAREAFQQLLDAAPVEKKIHMHGLLGVEWCRIGRHDLALPLLQTAITDPSSPAPVWEACASALDHLRRREEALHIIAEGLRRFPQHPGILLIRAAVERQQGDAARAEHTAREILALTHASPEAKAKAGHELGHALDAQLKYEQAYHAFLAAKAARAPQLAAFLPQWQQNLQHIATCPLPDRAQWIRWREQSGAADNLPIAMLVGCPRSGTTLLERVLDAHPRIISASETVVFSSLWNSHLRSSPEQTSSWQAMHQLTPEVRQSLRDRYVSDMEDSLEQPVGDHLLLDKNPSHLTRLPSILRVFPEAKILMALRDPRAIAWSCFTQYLPDNAESAAFHQLDLTATHVEAQLRFWQRLHDRLPDGTWHESRYERTVLDFDRETRATLTFLGFPWDAQVAEFHHNPDPVRSPTYAEAARPLYRSALEKWRHYEPYAGAMFRKLEAVSTI
jgi:tetratricopeptide (TPR) repeat protein